jgi:ATP-dependent helicase Lhr and Lhr-like helicase
MISVAAADPINLAGIIIPGDRIPAVPGKQIVYRNGTLYQEETSASAGKLQNILSPAMLATALPPAPGLFQQ